MPVNIFRKILSYVKARDQKSNLHMNYLRDIAWIWFVFEEFPTSGISRNISDRHNFLKLLIYQRLHSNATDNNLNMRCPWNFSAAQQLSE